MTPWVAILVAANVAMYFAQQSIPGLENMLAFYPGLDYLVARPWTPITYMFLHGSVSHIFWNMLGLFFFGPQVETRIGGRRFITLYLVSGLAGAALSFLSDAYIIGASGAEFGVFFAFARYWPRAQILVFGIVPVEARVLVVMMTVWSLLQGRFGHDNIAHFAHLGGYVGAYLYLTFSERRMTAAAREFKKRATAPPPVVAAAGNDVERWSLIDRDRLHAINRAEVDRLMAKIRQQGIASLTPEERATLDRFSAVS